MATNIQQLFFWLSLVYLTRLQGSRLGTYAHTDRQTTRTYNASGPIYRVGWGIKSGPSTPIAAAYVNDYSVTSLSGGYRLHTLNRLTALCPGLPGWAVTRKVKPIWILLKRETVRASGIRWAVYKSAPRSRQVTTPAPTTQFFKGRMPSCHPTNSTSGYSLSGPV